MKKRQIAGLLLIIAPPVLLVMTITAYAIGSFILATQVDARTTDLADVSGLFNIIVSGFGLLCLLGIMVGLPIGIILLVSNIGRKKIESKTIEQK